MWLYVVRIHSGKARCIGVVRDEVVVHYSSIGIVRCRRVRGLRARSSTSGIVRSEPEVDSWTCGLFSDGTSRGKGHRSGTDPTSHSYSGLLTGPNPFPIMDVSGLRRDSRVPLSFLLLMGVPLPPPSLTSVILSCS